MGSEHQRDTLDFYHLAAVWSGVGRGEYGVQAVAGTLALAIPAQDVKACLDDAHDLAARWWRERLTQPAQERGAAVS